MAGGRLVMLVKVHLIPSSFIPMVVGYGLLKNGDVVALPTKLIDNFLPDKDDKGPFVMMQKDYLDIIKKKRGSYAN